MLQLVTLFHFSLKHTYSQIPLKKFNNLRGNVIENENLKRKKC